MIAIKILISLFLIIHYVFTETTYSFQRYIYVRKPIILCFIYKKSFRWFFIGKQADYLNVLAEQSVEIHSEEEIRKFMTETKEEMIKKHKEYSSKEDIQE